MGFGLVAVPRHFWSLAKPSVLLQVRWGNTEAKGWLKGVQFDALKLFR